MNEDFIEYETASLAKEVGFDWKVIYAYNCYPNVEVPFKEYYSDFRNTEDFYVSAPTQSQLAKWIRERFNLLIRMYFNEEKLKFEPCYSLINIKTGFCTGISAEQAEFDSFEEANEESLKRTLRFIMRRRSI